MSGLVHRPPAKLEDQPRFLGDRDEFGWADFAAILMGPARERLKSGNFTRFQVDQRLIKKFQLILVERPAKFGFDRKTAPSFRGLLRLVNLWTTGLLGLLHGELSVAEQLF